MVKADQNQQGQADGGRRAPNDAVKRTTLTNEETEMKEMKKNNPLATKPAADKKPTTQKIADDPISVAKRKLDVARIDYKRTKELRVLNLSVTNDPNLALLKKELSEMKASRAGMADAVKKIKAELAVARLAIKAFSPRKKVLKVEIKKLSKGSTKHTAMDEARVAMLEAELVYRKACLG